MFELMSPFKSKPGEVSGDCSIQNHPLFFFELLDVAFVIVSLSDSSGYRWIEGFEIC